MVYSIRSNASLTSHRLLRKRQAKSEMSERINGFLNNRRISVQTYPNGVIKVKAVS